MSLVSGPRESTVQRPPSGGFPQDAASVTTKPMPKAASGTAGGGTAAVAPAESNVHYTCFIRLPFPRADFVDPQQVEWSSAKDRLLWKTISKASNSRELDWEELSARFDVSLPFLLQQGAWLYERHFAQMKAQMKKLSPSTNPSPIPPDSASNVSTPITGTFATNTFGPRATSALSSRTRDSPTPNAGSENLGTTKPSASSSIAAAGEAPFATYTTTAPRRTPSNRTVTQSRTAGATSNSPVPPSTRSFRSSFNNSQRKVGPTHQMVPQEEIETNADYESPPPAELSDSESSEEDENESRSMARSQAFRRPLASRKGKSGPPLSSYADEEEDEFDDEDEDEDGESSGGFLPFAANAAAASASRNEDVAATLRSPPPPKRTTAALVATERQGGRLGGVEDSTSSGGSSAAPAATGTHQPRRKHHHSHVHGHSHGQSHAQNDPASALSPRRVSMLSPQLLREGSEGAPSMGSSFSDLDDASISQSALEDAYLSNMQRGGTASRMSSISQALKSRYL